MDTHTPMELPILDTARREFALLPSGTSFRFPNESADEVWIKVGRHRCQLAQRVLRTVGDVMTEVEPVGVER